MGKVITFIYGLLIVFVALDAMFLGYIPSNLLPISVIAIGVIVLFTPISVRAPGGGTIGAPYNWLRRWVFGLAILILGVASSGFLGKFFSDDILGNFTLDTLVGQLILLLIGAIYFLASFKRTRKVQISSV